jgi:F420-dependent oxidoreductase-like protein
VVWQTPAMRIGLTFFAADPHSFVEGAKQAEAEGFTLLSTPQIFGPDALTCIALAAQHTSTIEFATAVVPTYPRHPTALAQQATTVQAAAGGRLILGIGLSHQVVIEGMLGMSFDKPAVHMREYLSIIGPLVRGGSVSYAGTTLTAHGDFGVPGGQGVPLMIAAMAPRMLELAGSMADGTMLWMTGPKTIESHIIPVMAGAAAKAGRPAPRTAAALPFCLTSEVAAARERAARELVIYGQLPSYRAMLDHEGLAGPEDLAVVGDEATLTAAIDRMRDVGTDDLTVSLFGSDEEQARTRAFIASLL